MSRGGLGENHKEFGLIWWRRVNGHKFAGWESHKLDGMGLAPLTVGPSRSPHHPSAGGARSALLAFSSAGPAVFHTHSRCPSVHRGWRPSIARPSMALALRRREDTQPIQFIKSVVFACASKWSEIHLHHTRVSFATLARANFAWIHMDADASTTHTHTQIFATKQDSLDSDSNGSSWLLVSLSVSIARAAVTSPCLCFDICVRWSC